MKLSSTFLASLLTSLLLISLAGCDNSGPAERAGEQIDDTVEDIGDTFDDATDNN